GTRSPPGGPGVVAAARGLGAATAPGEGRGGRAGAGLGPDAEFVAAGVGEVEAAAAGEGVGAVDHPAAGGGHRLCRAVQVLGEEQHERSAAAHLLAAGQAADLVPVRALDAGVAGAVVVEPPPERL